MPEPLPSPSFWWDQLGGPRRSRPRLEGAERADVVVVGAGYSGLWTAYELLRAEPTIDVVVLESSVVGYGASGRNGGWLSGLLGGPRDTWAARCGRDAVTRLQHELDATVGYVGSVCRTEGIDCDLRADGVLLVATNAPQVARLHEWRAEELAWGAPPEDWQLLDAGGVRERISIAGARAAIHNPHCARLQPAGLVRGLADAVVRLGGRIFEDSAVRTIGPRRVTTDTGRVDATWVVRATEGFTARLPALRRAVLPMNSAMVVTEPLPEAVWAEIGWRGAETFHDLRHRYVYLQRTADDRIAIGGRGHPYRFASRVEPDGRLDEATVRELRARLVSLFPAVRDARIVRGWCGVLGVTRDWSPRISADRVTGLCATGGYAGDGVAAASLAGRTLRDLILGLDSPLVDLPWVDHPERSWEPEPLRWLGVHAVYGLYRWIDRHEAATDRASRLLPVATRLSGR